jgi:hypothetical protein
MEMVGTARRGTARHGNSTVIGVGSHSSTRSMDYERPCLNLNHRMHLNQEERSQCLQCGAHHFILSLSCLTHDAQAKLELEEQKSEAFFHFLELEVQKKVKESEAFGRMTCWFGIEPVRLHAGLSKHPSGPPPHVEQERHGPPPKLSGICCR